MQLIHGNWGWLWLLLLGVGVVLWLVAMRAKNVFQTWFTRGEYTFHYPFVKNGLRVAGLACTLVALMGPYLNGPGTHAEVLGRQVYFLLDVSASMNSPDLKPSRLEKTKTELKRILPALAGDEVGLMVFTNFAYVQCPLTTDASALSLFTDIVQTGQFGNTGTNFRTALNQVFARFNKEKVRDSIPENDHIARVVVLLTDGEDHGEKFQSVLNQMHEAGVYVIPVGIGTLAGGPIPEVDAANRPAEYKRNSDGSTRLTRLEEESLKAIAEEFGTPYLKLDATGASLDPLIDAIRAIPPGVLASREALAGADRYQWFLLPGILLLLTSLFILPQKKLIMQ